MKPTDPTPDLQQARIAGEVHILDLMEAPTMADPDYLHWQKLKHLQPPHGWDARRWWFQLKWQRSHQARRLPLLDVHGRPDIGRAHGAERECGVTTARCQPRASPHAGRCEW